MKYISCLLAAPAVALLLGSCSEMDDVFGLNTNKEIKFKAVEASDWNQTRAAEAPTTLEPIKMKSEDGITAYVHTTIQNGIESGQSVNKTTTRGTEITTSSLEEFSVLAYRYDKNVAWDSQTTLTPNFFYNKKATKDETDGNFRMTKNSYWPSTDDRITFCAYAPVGSKSIELSGEDEAGKPYINFTVNNTITAQSDLITAVAKNQDPDIGENNVELQFSHALTAVKFVVGSDLMDALGYYAWNSFNNYADGTPTQITSISLVNVIGTGTYTFGEGWTAKGEADQTYTLTGLTTSVTSEEGTAISADNQTFFMIPQSFTNENQYLEVSFTDCNNYTRKLILFLKGTAEWRSGETVTYQLSNSAIRNITFNGFEANGVYRNYNGQWNSETESYDNPFSFSNGDKVGCYVLDSDGKVIAANVCYTYNAGSDSWTAQENVPYNYSHKYCFYYPYQQSHAGLPQLNDVFDLSGTSNYNVWQVVFDQLRRNWVIPSDVTEETIEEYELLAGNSVANGYLSTIGGNGGISSSIPLNSAIGWINFVLGKRNVITGGSYTLYQYDDMSWAIPGESATTASIEASRPNCIHILAGGSSSKVEFDYNYASIPCTYGTTKTISGVDNDWEVQMVAGNNSYSGYPVVYPLTVATGGTCTATEQYEPLIGDVVYSNGEISHAYDASIGTARGMIVYLGNDVNIDNRSHGVVMALNEKYQYYYSSTYRINSGYFSAMNQPSIDTWKIICDNSETMSSLNEKLSTISTAGASDVSVLRNTYYVTCETVPSNSSYTAYKTYNPSNGLESTGQFGSNSSYSKYQRFCCAF
ncbi:MAG: fimbrillin family protein [Prevotella sp.]|nr:fimbrillin family protein [Prevotella sp.]